MKKSHPAVCYYVTGHGLGHASRAMQVMQRIPEDVPLYIKTLAPAHFFRRELRRPFTLIHQGLDTGCWQESNFAVDWDRTFTHAMRVQRQARRQMRAETAFLKSHNVGVVATDAGAPPLRAACDAGIPGIAVVNFTWIDIFGKHAAGIPERENLLREYRHDYATATLALRTPFCFPMNCFRSIRPIPLIARRGRAMRAELRRAAGAGPRDRMVLLYFGN